MSAGSETAGARAAARSQERPAVRVSGVSKRYRRSSPGDRLKTLKSALLARRRPDDSDTIHALESIDFRVAKGEAFGVIGGNGSGKSTLLKMLADILKPSAGTIEIEGRTAALIELGAGFHPEISGRENVYINGAILGLTRQQVDERYQRIVDFSGLAEFMEEPVKNYSSGMYVRLGFSVAIHTDPEVLLVDEVLAVGDESFTHRSIHRIQEFLAAGRTLVFVSHDLSLVETLCDRVLWIDRGRARLVGSPRRVIDAYRQAVAEDEGRAHQQELETVTEEGGDPVADETGEVMRWGSGEAEVVGCRLIAGGRIGSSDSAESGEMGEERYHVHSGEPVCFEIEVRAKQLLDDFVFGVLVTTPRGEECWGTNTDLAGLASGHFEGEATVRLQCPSLRLGPGDYLVDVAIHRRDGTSYDYRRRVFSFTVTAQSRGVGIYFPEHEWLAEGGIAWSPVDDTRRPGRPSETSEANHASPTDEME